MHNLLQSRVHYMYPSLTRVALCSPHLCHYIDHPLHCHVQYLPSAICPQLFQFASILLED